MRYDQNLESLKTHEPDRRNPWKQIRVSPERVIKIRELLGGKHGNMGN